MLSIGLKSSVLLKYSTIAIRSKSICLNAMTVHYTPTVSNAHFVDFLRVLMRWRGSVWKLILPELCIWLLAYFVLSLVYRLALSPDQKKTFEMVTISCSQTLNYVPVTFILGFYVSFVMGRWWYQFNNLGWIDSLALSTAGWIQGLDEKARLLRRTVLRYMLLYQMLIYRNISISIRKIYPSIGTLVDAVFGCKAIDNNVPYWNRYTR
uniref:Bestrophin homolog n=1 Tax=Syphacia muris TaxID=451379 RepID=A0A0N5APH7_9BILA